MEPKRKKWQRYLIYAVLILTVYNILPTLFYYTKPLKTAIDEPRGNNIALQIAERTNTLESESLDWLKSFCKLLDIKAQSIDWNAKEPGRISLKFVKEEEAARFRKFLPRAGALVPFVPSQLTLMPDAGVGREVTVLRKIPLHLEPQEIASYFQFSQKRGSDGRVTPTFRALIEDRTLQLGLSLGGTTENGRLLQAAVQNPQENRELLLLLATNVLNGANAFEEKSPIAQRYFASFTQVEGANPKQLTASFESALSHLYDETRLERIALDEEKKRLEGEKRFLDETKQMRQAELRQREWVLEEARAIFRRHESSFANAKAPFTTGSFGALLQESANQAGAQHTSLQGRNPFIQEISIDWDAERIRLKLYDDLLLLKRKLLASDNPEVAAQRDLVEQLLFNELAAVSRAGDEKLNFAQDEYEIPLSQLQNSKSFLLLRLSALAEAEMRTTQSLLLSSWQPKSPELSRENYPIFDWKQTSPSKQRLGLVLFAPALMGSQPIQGFHRNSIYVIARGMGHLLDKAQGSEAAEATQTDGKALIDLLGQQGFLAYAGSTLGLPAEYNGDLIFEKEDYFAPLIKATREDFQVHGTKRFALLEFTDVEQRILTENRIDNQIHEDLLRWRDDYRAASMSLKGLKPLDVPKPTQNALIDNFMLSFVKYFRGDDRKILRWGLDLSGGKTVQIELHDTAGRMVTDPTDLRQGVNELYKRVNRLGLSEVSIRQEGNHISLDFPGSQGLSASELVKASSMNFFVVNEKFQRGNTTLAAYVDRFLQEVWNEAVVTGRKEVDEINSIARAHLYGDRLATGPAKPRSEAARQLYENGLRFAPAGEAATTSFNDTFSRIGVLRGDEPTSWQGQTHPLIVLFHNFALEGSSLDNVHASYDPSHGNFLSFNVRSSQASEKSEKYNPRDALYAWTSLFSKEKVLGTPQEAYTGGRGWRMAVVLNGEIISSPTLDSALRDSAMISGSFTQREVNQLEADLKAGSLSFTPRILQEKNVSPELGTHERLLGIAAMGIALLFALAVLVGYYRFAGTVAGIALLFNLLIMWAALQNIHATLTLASIAGLILTLALAVDANVLVFERIKEEFLASGRLSSAISAGYRRAFSAILDSNVTTLIAALILFQFDSGPIKGLALTLIIGVVSSFFTALFMTRTFFIEWAQNPEHRTLKMSHFLKGTNIDFLRYSKTTIIFSLVVIVAGAFLFSKEKKTLLGMDFTGGETLQVELVSRADMNYRTQVETALQKAGAHANEFQVRELTPSNVLRLFFSRSMEERGHPFAKLPPAPQPGTAFYAYEYNPKIAWAISALQAAGLEVTPSSLQTIDRTFTEVSGQMSSSMRNNSLFGLLLALFFVTLYLTFRFEFKYAISATICVAHDVFFTCAALALLHALGIQVQFDLNTVAALMTIIGYSLNDTIIVFDRIREELKQRRREGFSAVVNFALNVTLSRTIMTSGITLLVLLPMVALGGSTIFGFALTLSVGVIFGTLSSLFIAAPLLEYFQKRDKEKSSLISPTAQHTL